MILLLQSVTVHNASTYIVVLYIYITVVIYTIHLYYYIILIMFDVYNIMLAIIVMNIYNVINAHEQMSSCGEV